MYEYSRTRCFWTKIWGVIVVDEINFSNIQRSQSLIIIEDDLCVLRIVSECGEDIFLCSSAHKIFAFSLFFILVRVSMLSVLLFPILFQNLLFMLFLLFLQPLHKLDKLRTWVNDFIGDYIILLCLYYFHIAYFFSTPISKNLYFIRKFNQ